MAFFRGHERTKPCPPASPECQVGPAADERSTRRLLQGLARAVRRALRTDTQGDRTGALQASARIDLRYGCRRRRRRLSICARRRACRPDDGAAPARRTSIVAAEHAIL